MNLAAHIENLRQSGGMSRKVIVWLTISLIIVLAFAGLKWEMKRKLERKRTEWKTATLKRLASQPNLNKEILREIETLKAVPVRGERRLWVGDQVLLMTNGESITYAFWH